MAQGDFYPDEQRPSIAIKRRSSLLRISLAGCVGTLIFLAIAAGIGVAILSVFFPNALNGIIGGITGVQVPQTRALPGSAGAFDPVASFAAVSAFAGSDAQLTSISAANVRSDGTLDLNATYSPAPRVDYEFVHEVPRPADAPPVGAGGTGTGPWYEPVTIEVYQPGARRHVTRIGGGVSTSFDYVNDGMTRDTDSPTTSLSDPIVVAPKCGFADLWKVALQNDAPKDAVARIDYKAAGYSFSISALKVYLQFDLDCRLKK
ncbi:MAG TPA: hypothetical protein VMT34_02975 [Aggregatilineales bacterium]|nr:hypothetical protein [Aggregatilineales bacterium]